MQCEHGYWRLFHLCGPLSCVQANFKAWLCRLVPHSHRWIASSLLATTRTRGWERRLSASRLAMSPVAKSSSTMPRWVLSLPGSQAFQKSKRLLCIWWIGYIHLRALPTWIGLTTCLAPTALVVCFARLDCLPGLLVCLLHKILGNMKPWIDCFYCTKSFVFKSCRCFGLLSICQNAMYTITEDMKCTKSEARGIFEQCIPSKWLWHFTVRHHLDKSQVSKE